MPFVEFRAWVAELGRRRDEEKRAREDAERRQEAERRRREFLAQHGVR